MSDKPILFSGPMVRAIVEGRKTQTRRALPQAHPEFPKHNHLRLDVLAFDPNHPEVWFWDGVYDRVGASYPIRYAVGDRLYVREAWQGLTFGDYEPTSNWPCDYRYRATDPLADCDVEIRGYPWRPSIHMPRRASRLTLIVTDVRVQRLQDISEADALEEGATQRPACHGFRSMENGWSMDWDQVGRISRFAGGIHPRGKGKPLSERDISLGCARMAFASYWNELAGPGTTWLDNPWIVAITFDTHHCNIDALAKDAAE